MAILTQLTEGGVAGFIKGAGTLARDIRAAVTGKEVLTSEERLRILDATHALEVESLKADALLAQGQLDINKADAQSGSLFRGGWRPAVGWVCVFGLSYQFILRPLVPWAVDACGYVVKDLPSLDMSTLMTLLMGILGLGGFRTFEKVRGVGK